jgi:enoyl-CoA hydratase
MNTVMYEQKEQVGYITFNRPEKGNAINSEMASDLHNLMERDIVNSKDLSALILAGMGDSFMYGADVTEFRDYEKNHIHVDNFTNKSRRFMRGLARIPQFSIAAVHGYALGGGLEMALACDYIIASESAKFGFPEIQFGLLPGAGGTQLLPRRVGDSIATRMILSGEIIGADDALRLRLVDEVVLQEELMTAAENCADKVLSNPRYAQEAAKRCIQKSATGIDFDIERECFDTCLQQEETQRRIYAFLRREK